MDDILVIGNQIEALIWFGFTVIFSFFVFRSAERKRRLWVVLAIAFFVFGISDLIESRTGAWWEPWWLLLMKGTCLCIFAWGVWEYRTLYLPSRSPIT